MKKQIQMESRENAKWDIWDDFELIRIDEFSNERVCARSPLPELLETAQDEEVFGSRNEYLLFAPDGELIIQSSISGVVCSVISILDASKAA